MIIAVPRDGAIIFGDLIGKLDMLRVACETCGRNGRYRRLIEMRGRDAKVIDWLDKLTAGCPKKLARNLNDPCGARCQDLARVLYATGIKPVSPPPASEMRQRRASPRKSLVHIPVLSN